MIDADKIQKLKAHETDLLEQRFKLETRQDEIESALSLLNARLEEVRGALELFDDIDRARAATAKAPKVEPTKAPREICADQIEAAFAGKELPVDTDAVLVEIDGVFNPRTIRSALNLVAQRRKKAGADRLQAPAVLPDSAAPVGSEPEVDPLEIPPGLRRTRENAA